MRGGAAFEIEFLELAGSGIERGDVVGSLPDEPDASVRTDVWIPRAGRLIGDRPFIDVDERRVGCRDLR
jgi:hypothetical protein